MKDQIKLMIPAYDSQAEIHDHFATCVTDPRRLDLAMSGSAQAAKFFSELKTVCPQARAYSDPGGSPWNSGTLMPITVIYPDEGMSFTDDGHCFPIRQKVYHYCDCNILIGNVYSKSDLLIGLISDKPEVMPRYASNEAILFVHRPFRQHG